MQARLKQIEDSRPIGYRNTMKNEQEFNELKDVKELHPDREKDLSREILPAEKQILQPDWHFLEA